MKKSLSKIRSQDITRADLIEKKKKRKKIILSICFSFTVLSTHVNLILNYKTLIKNTFYE